MIGILILFLDDLFGDKDKSKSKWSIFFELNDEQLKWVIIIGGVTALVILVVIQALCMVWKDGKNKERKPTAKVSLFFLNQIY